MHRRGSSPSQSSVFVKRVRGLPDLQTSSQSHGSESGGQRPGVATTVSHMASLRRYWVISLAAALLVAVLAATLVMRAQDEQVVVPPLPNTTSMREARAVLEDAGLVVHVKGVDCGPPGFCKTGPVETEPQAGSTVASGSTVVLYARGYADDPP